MDGLGNILWQKTFGGSEYDKAYSIQQTLDKGYIFAGSTFSNDGDISYSHGYEDFWVVKGEFYGWFEMGSTILTFSQKGSIFPEVAINQKVKFTDVLGKVL